MEDKKKKYMEQAAAEVAEAIELTDEALEELSHNYAPEEGTLEETESMTETEG